MKYKLKPAVANAKSFRFNGQKYATNSVDQKILKSLFKQGFEYVTEIKESKKTSKNAKAEDSTEN